MRLEFNTSIFYNMNIFEITIPAISELVDDIYIPTDHIIFNNVYMYKL